ncbi:uncharacterized protein LOC129289292 [Prosopis cineraria]|uniref:uncharacterized protein LOC129289292 n=1 Tax=Prosopis cineraria TaxID=364024 RepID=UPI00240F54BB|nr:uncharacterized protein LOC129289292 [Prosopis cineraria]
MPADYLRGLIFEPIDANYPLPIPTLDAFTVGKAMLISFDQSMYGREQHDVVRVEIVNEVLKRISISQNVVHFYMRYLYENFIAPGDPALKFIFVCPHDVSPHHNITTKVRYSQAQTLAKYFEAKNPTAGMLFLAVMLYRTKKNLPVPLRYKSYDLGYPNWKIIKCPRQIAYSEDCGYCVMRFLKDIITHGLTLIPPAYYLDSYYDELGDYHINEVIEEWCEYIF